MSESNLVPPGEDIHAPVKAFARAGVGLIPGLGGFINELAGFHASSVIAKRNHDWMTAVYEKLLELEKRTDSFKIEDAIKDEEFCSAVYNARLLATGTHREEIRKAARNVVLNHAVGVSISEYRQLKFVGFLRRFTTTHLNMISLCENAANVRNLYFEKLKANKNSEDLESMILLTGFDESTLSFDKYYADVLEKLEPDYFIDILTESLGHGEKLGLTITVASNRQKKKRSEGVVSDSIVTDIHDELVSVDRLIRDFANLQEWPTKSLLTEEGDAFLKYINEPNVLAEDG